jgi:uncharacterized membrane protein YphA (DoxX/SURF4 family)
MIVTHRVIGGSNERTSPRLRGEADFARRLYLFFHWEDRPLTANRNQINPLTKLFMIVLRIAIGWHLLYEGYSKISSTMDGKKPFSAEMYLRQSTGPLRFYFRGLVDDFHGLAFLDADQVTAVWDKYLNEQGAKNSISGESMEELQKTLTSIKDSLSAYLKEKEDDIARYKEDIADWEAQEQRPLPPWIEKPQGKFLKDPLPPFEWEAHKKNQKKLDAKRAELIGPVLKWSDELVEAVSGQISKTNPAAKEDVEAGLRSAAIPSAKAAPILWKPKLQQINLTTMWGLAICGGLLVMGLFTRLAALGGAALLALFYLSMPPWPGLDPAPIAEGTYLIVNKNLIELVALLMLATSPAGVWGGIDSLIRGLFTRPVLGIGKSEIPRVEV